MAYLLDTNHCFLLLARDARLAAAVAERASEQLRTGHGRAIPVQYLRRTS